METRRAGWVAAAVLTVGAVTGCGPQGTTVARAAEAGEEAPARGGSTAAARAASLQDLQTTAAAESAQTSRSNQDPGDSRRTAIVRAANRVAPAVVNVSVISRERAEPTSLWESFFMPPDAQRRAAGFGSGVVIRSDGIIVTNNHVVQNAERIRVTLPDGRDFDAELVGTDPVADIAVLRIHGDSLPVAPLGTSKGLLIGEWAVAIGNPFANYFSDAEPTVTAGVISAVDRNIVPSSNDDGFYLGMIQTDASINPGNSGGPLVDALGQVIGINASIFTRSGGSEGMGFAIPIDRALRVADDLVNHGEVRRAWTGIDVAAVEADAWGRTRGVRVSRVAPDSPGDKAGVEVGDRLLRANGHALTTPLDFEAVLLDLRAGDAIELTIDGRSRPLHLTAAALPSVTAARVTVLQDMQLITVTPQIRAERGIQSKQGALIASISDNLSSQLGLQKGDVLVQVNRTPVTSAEDAKQIFESLKGQGNIRLWVERNGGYVVRDLYWRR
jgi:serine protease Do